MRSVAAVAMPSFVLSFALLLLVLLTLLAVSNRELIALTFLGFSTVALPLSVWILGAIAVGFLVGLWILLLFRFGTVGSGSGSPFRDKRRANYGPEDFAVVDDRAEEQPAPVYRDGRYDDNRYDDIYGRDQYEGRSGVSERDSESYPAERNYREVDRQSSADGYDSGSYDTGYDRGGDRYGSESYASEGYDSGTYENNPAKPQDSFSASTGYSNTEDRGASATPSSSAESAADEGATGSSRSDRSKPPLPKASATDPAMPLDWDDQYREDWTQEELVLRDQNAAPKLKRWLNSTNGEERPLLNLGGFGLGGSKSGPDSDLGSNPDSERETNAMEQPEPIVADVEAGQDYRPAYQGDESDWQAAGGYGDPSYGDRSETNRDNRNPDVSNRDVYDADYRVIRKPVPDADGVNPVPETSSTAWPEPSATPQAVPEQPEPESLKPEKRKSEQRDRGGKDDWDIDSDLGW